MLKPQLISYLDRLKSERDIISAERMKALQTFARQIYQSIQSTGSCSIVVICTHNSRRSQLCELWISVFAHVYGMTSITVYSGGTEATAFHPNMVGAIQDKGFDLEEDASKSNPRYFLSLGQGVPPHTFFSKTIGDAFNPQSNFLAILVCSQADHDCPMVPGAAWRLSLPYEDPKAFDNTDLQEIKYKEKVDEIGREMSYLFHLLSQDISERSE